MNIEDMILVIDTERGKEVNFLYTFEDYVSVVVLPRYPIVRDAMAAAAELFNTRKAARDWSEVAFSGHRAFYARFCEDQEQLRSFLRGHMNENGGKGKAWSFEKSRCSSECICFLKYLGLTVEGKPRYGEYDYEREEEVFFAEDQIITDFSGFKYKIMEALSKEDFILMSLKTGAVSLAEKVRLYGRYPNDEEPTLNNIVYGVTWEKNTHLSWKATGINMEKVQEAYKRSREGRTCKVR
ncbi:MAG: hypothetical protein LUE94_15725 [Clostridiales bacterium]|nr:hypothetical protein [Clostridiales bacterium]